MSVLSRFFCSIILQIYTIKQVMKNQKYSAKEHSYAYKLGKSMPCQYISSES